MKIKLTKDIPVDKKHGMFKGKIYKLIKEKDKDSLSVWVRSHVTNEAVQLLPGEFEIIEGQ